MNLVITEHRKIMLCIGLIKITQYMLYCILFVSNSCINCTNI